MATDGSAFGAADGAADGPLISCPLRFVAGHSHVRAFRVLDNHSVAYEAGNYLNTVGFASFSYPSNASSSSSSSTSSNFEYRNIDANQVSMASVAGLNSTTPLLTAAGAALQAEIVRVAATLGLNDVLGCAPRTYRTYLPLNSAESLWRLWMQEVTTQAALGSNASRIVVQSTGALRYDLFSGPVTRNDIWTMCPFADQYWRVASNVNGVDLRMILSSLGADPGSSGGATRRRARALQSGALPAYAATSAPVDGRMYAANRPADAMLTPCWPVIATRIATLAPRDLWGDLSGELWAVSRQLPLSAIRVCLSAPDCRYELWTDSYDLNRVKQAYEAKTNQTATPVVMLNGSTTTELWFDWVPRAWPCVQSTGDPWRQLDYLVYTRYCLLAFCLAVVTTVMTVATIAAYREWKPYILAVFFLVRVRVSGRSTRELPVEVQAKELEEVPAKTLVGVPAKTLVEVPAKTLVEVPAKTLVEVPANSLVPRGATEGAGTTLGSTPTPMWVPGSQPRPRRPFHVDFHVRCRMTGMSFDNTAATSVDGM